MKDLSKKSEGKKTGTSWVNCLLRDDEAVSIEHYEAVAVGDG